MRHISLTILILALVAALTSPHETHAQDGAAETDLEALGTKLKAAIASGEMTEEEASAEYEKAVGRMKGVKTGTDKGKGNKNWEVPAINGLPLFTKRTRRYRSNRWRLVRFQPYRVH